MPNIDPVILVAVLAVIGSVVASIGSFVPAILAIYISLRKNRVESDEIISRLQQEYIKPLESEMSTLKLELKLSSHRLAERDATIVELRLLLAKCLGGITILTGQVREYGVVPKFVLDESILVELRKYIEAEQQHESD